MFTFAIMNKKLPTKKLKVNNSSLVRISNKSIKDAKKIKKKQSTGSIGKLYENALDYYNVSENIL